MTIREKTKRYSFERETAGLEPAHERLFETNKAAWEFFQREPSSRRKMLTWWIASDVKEEMRMNRLKILIKACDEGRRLM